jgi:hypothetical protein
MRGRKPIPTSLKLLHGNPRAATYPRRRAEAACLPANLSGASVADRQGRMEASRAEPQRDRAADPGRPGGARRLLPVLRPLGRGRAEARRNPGHPEDTCRLRPALALARHLHQAARAHGEVHGGDGADAIVAQPSRNQGAHRAEAVGVRPRRVRRLTGAVFALSYRTAQRTSGSSVRRRRVRVVRLRAGQHRAPRCQRARHRGAASSDRRLRRSAHCDTDRPPHRGRERQEPRPAATEAGVAPG